MKKKLILLLIVLLSSTILSLSNGIQVDSYILEENFSEKISHNNRNFLVKLYPQNQRRYSFETLTDLIKKPETNTKSGNVSKTNHKKHLLSSSFELGVKLKDIFNEISGKVSFGYSYEFGEAITITYDWHYSKENYGDYAIFGIKRTAVKYYYEIYEQFVDKVDGPKGSEPTYHHHEKKIETGYVWHHYHVGEIDLFAFYKRNYNEALYLLEKGVFPSFMFNAYNLPGGGSSLNPNENPGSSIINIIDC